MTYATVEERKALKNSSLAFDQCPFVVRFEKAGRQSELVADDIEHALNLQKSWIDKDADYVEIFRVLHNGELNPTIGPYQKVDWIKRWEENPDGPNAA